MYQGLESRSVGLCTVPLSAARDSSGGGRGGWLAMCLLTPRHWPSLGLRVFASSHFAAGAASLMGSGTCEPGGLTLQQASRLARGGIHLPACCAEVTPRALPSATAGARRGARLSRLPRSQRERPRGPHQIPSQQPNERRDPLQKGAPAGCHLPCPHEAVGCEFGRGQPVSQDRAAGQGPRGGRGRRGPAGPREEPNAGGSRRAG